MTLTASETRLLRKLFESMRDFEENRVVVMAKLPPTRLFVKEGNRFIRHEISPEWVEQQKLKLPAEAKALSLRGLIRLFVDGKETLKHGKIDFVAQMTPLGLKTFREESLGA